MKMLTALSADSGTADHPRDFDWVSKNVPCQHACPAGTDIPEYLSAIAAGDYESAYRVNLRDNIFPGVLGRVCARPCEPPCRHGWTDLGSPVAICFSKRASYDHRDQKPVVLARLPETGKKVAVIGAGPAGLAAARNLSLFGHHTTVFEQHTSPGGMMRQGIPGFRLPRSVLDLEIRQVELCGVEIRSGIRIGRDLPAAELAGSFDAVIIAAGTLSPVTPPWALPEAQGVEHGLRFLFEVNEKGRTAIGAAVAVIGGGFTAIDCARTALRLGAREVTVFYRRSRDDLHVTPGELEELEREKIGLEFRTQPAQLFAPDGRLSLVRFVRTSTGAGVQESVEVIPGSEFERSCDTLLMATGQKADRSWIEASLLQDIRTRQNQGEKYFLAGDFAAGPSNIIQAIGNGKRCALEVDRYLTGAERFPELVRIETGRSRRRSRQADAAERQKPPAAEPQARSLEAEVELGFDAPASRIEADRCYLCHYKYEIDIKRCIYCNQCLEVKPRPDCIAVVHGLKIDEQERICGWEPKKDNLLPGASRFYYYINQEDCIRCNACLEVCPVKCISVQKVSLTRKVWS